MWLSFFVQPQCCHPAPPAHRPHWSHGLPPQRQARLGWSWAASWLPACGRTSGPWDSHLSWRMAGMRIGSTQIAQGSSQQLSFFWFYMFFLNLVRGVNAPITSYNWDWCLLHPFDGSWDGFSYWWYCQAVLVVSSTSKVPQRRSPRNISRRNTRQIYNLYNILCTIGSAWEFVPIVGYEAIFSVRRLLKPPKNGKPIITITHITKIQKMDYHAQPFGENTYRDWRYYSKRRRKLRVESNNWKHWMIMPSALSDQFPSCSCIWTSMFNSVYRFWCPSSIF